MRNCCYLATSSCRAKQVGEAVARNAEVLAASSPYILCVDNSLEEVGWERYFEGYSGGIQGFIDPSNYCCDRRFLYNSCNEVIVRPWRGKHTGDADLTAIGVEEAKRKGFRWLLKLSGVQRLFSNPFYEWHRAEGGILATHEDGRNLVGSRFFLADLAEPTVVEALTDARLWTDDGRLYENRLHEVLEEKGVPIEGWDDWPTFFRDYNAVPSMPIDWSVFADRFDLFCAYQQAVQSNIAGHCASLAGVVREEKAKRVMELGVGEGISTLCFLQALRGQGVLESVDICPCDTARERVRSMGLTEHWHFTCQDDLQYVKKLRGEVDILFIDTSHTALHTKAELELFSPHLRLGGILLMHDTISFPAGVMEPFQRFNQSGAYQVLSHREESNGLLIARKVVV